MNSTMMTLAALGATIRVKELETELAAIRQAFPNLPAAERSTASVVAKRATRGYRMSARARKVVSIRMKQYWADRRSAAAKPKNRSAARKPRAVTTPAVNE